LTVFFRDESGGEEEQFECIGHDSIPKRGGKNSRGSRRPSHHKMSAIRERSTRDGPFCWQSKAAYDLILDKFADTGDTTSALALYVGLTRIASDQGCPTFMKSLTYVAQKCGMSRRTAGNFLAPFEEIGLIHVQKNTMPGSKLKAPHRITVLSMGNNCASMGSENPHPIPKIIKNSKNQKNDEAKPCGSSLRAGLDLASPKSSTSFCGSYHNHIKWPEFEAHAKRLAKIPKADWFERWLAKQRPEWRNKKSPQQEVLEKRGYVLNGKFFTVDEANRAAISSPELIEKFQPAERRNGKVTINSR
jgi:hypothetical protein